MRMSLNVFGESLTFNSLNKCYSVKTGMFRISCSVAFSKFEDNGQYNHAQIWLNYNKVPPFGEMNFAWGCYFAS